MSMEITRLIGDLETYVRRALERADLNGNGKIAKKERSEIGADVRAGVEALRASKKNFSIKKFMKDFMAESRTAIDRANGDGNAQLSTSERDSLPSTLSGIIRAMASGSPEPEPTAGVFGISGAVPASAARLTTILDRHLDRPTGLAFHPDNGSLWIVNRGDDSSVVVDSPGASGQRATRYEDDSAHFMNNPMAIAFSRTRNEFAIVGDSANDYNGHHPGNHFMGPTLFTANRGDYEGGTNSHIDMLHHSPLAVGIAAGKKVSTSNDKREYWVFNGESGSVDRYFFNQPHALGGEDHADGLTFRYAAGELARVSGVPGHLALDADGTLYIADTGNGRIAKLDPGASLSGAVGISGWHDETPLYQMPGAHLETVTSAVQRPAGLLIHNDMLVVSDYATGHIKVFDKAGSLVGDLNTGRGPNAVTGLAVSPGGELYFLDAARNEVVRLDSVG